MAQSFKSCYSFLTSMVVGILAGLSSASCSDSSTPTSSSSGVEVVQGELVKHGRYVQSIRIFDHQDGLGKAYIDTFPYDLQAAGASMRAGGTGEQRLIAVSNASPMAHMKHDVITIPAYGGRPASSITYSGHNDGPPSLQEISVGGQLVSSTTTEWKRISSGWVKSEEVQQIFGGGRVVATVTTLFDAITDSNSANAFLMNEEEPGPECSGDGYDYCDEASYEPSDGFSSDCQSEYNTLMDDADAVEEASAIAIAACIFPADPPCAAAGVHMYYRVRKYNNDVDKLNGCIESKVSYADSSIYGPALDGWHWDHQSMWPW